ncbi:hypothetical protein CR513_62518, partial [Mucuna pruriens]
MVASPSLQIGPTTPSLPWTLMLPTILNSSCPTSHMGATTLDHDTKGRCGLAMEKNNSFPKYSEFGFTERSNSYNFNGPKGGGFCAANDPELKRKKRIKAYNVFTMEGKLKTSVRNGFKWIKNKFGEW